MRLIHLSALAHALALLVAVPAVAAACTCVSVPLCQAMWMSGGGAPAFFEGTVESIDPIDTGMVRVRLRDVRAIHGTSSSEVITSALDDSCGYPFTVGERYLIDGVPRAAGAVSTSSCSKTAPIENAAENLA